MPKNKNEAKMDRKHIDISEDIHRRVKVFAAQNNMKMDDAVEYLLDYFEGKKGKI